MFLSQKRRRPAAVGGKLPPLKFFFLEQKTLLLRLILSYHQRSLLEEFFSSHLRSMPFLPAAEKIFLPDVSVPLFAKISLFFLHSQRLIFRKPSAPSRCQNLQQKTRRPLTRWSHCSVNAFPLLSLTESIARTSLRKARRPCRKTVCFS